VLRDRAQNLDKHAVGIVHHIVIPEPQHEVTHCLQDSGSIRIAFSVLLVLTTIKFHNELGVRAEKIDDETIDRHLSLELPSGQTAIA
jgi:hypothetical protein